MKYLTINERDLAVFERWKNGDSVSTIARDEHVSVQRIYKIVNSLDTVKNIPRKMKNQIDDVNTTNRVYFNKFDPIIYTKIVDNHVELALRFLMHPKKARYIESVIWNKIYLGYKEGKINLYVKD